MKGSIGWYGGRSVLLALTALVVFGAVLLSGFDAHALVEANCRGCHNDAAGSTVERHHALINAQAKQCMDCHQMILDANNNYNPVVVRDCLACHGQLTHQGRHHALINEQGKQCMECHQMLADAAGNFNPVVVRDCSFCHTAMNPKTNHANATVNAECAQCHNRGVVDEHTSRTSTCYTCHSSDNVTVQQTIMAGKAGTMVSCTSCHTSAYHVAQHDMASTTAECAQCHTRGVMGEHLTRSSTCATCHSSTNLAVQQAITAGKSGSMVYCVNCHASVNHIAQHDKVTTPADCAACHTKNVVNEHTDRSSSCATCHNSSNQTVLNTIIAGRAGTLVSCSNCHGTVNHAAQHDKAQNTAACSQCHTKSVLDEHLTRTSSCATCHSSSRVEVQDAISAGRAGTVVTCVTCHGQYNHPSAHTGKVSAPYEDCNSCHITNLTELHAQKGFLCAACHDGTISNPAISAAVQKGIAGQMVVCADCHNSINGFGNHAGQHDSITLADQPGFITAHEEKQIYCFACHNNTSDQKVINDGMAGIQQSCTSCHVSYGNQPPLANAGPDLTATVNQSVSFSGSASSDADGSISSYVWNFGDGSSASGATASKTYTAAGSYTITLTVTDNLGASASDTAVVTVQPASSSVVADQVQQMTSLYSVTSSDSNSRDVTAIFRDANLSDRYLLQNSSRNSYVLAMKLNRDVLTASKVVLRLYVSSISSSRTLRIYPYKSDGSTVNTSYSVSFSTSSTGWKDIDVTSIATRMNGYGWMKFRVTPTSSSLYVAEGAFQVQ